MSSYTQEIIAMSPGCSPACFRVRLRAQQEPSKDFLTLPLELMQHTRSRGTYGAEQHRYIAQPADSYPENSDPALTQTI